MKESSPFLQTPIWLGRLRAWLFRRQTLRFALVAVGTLLTLIAVFYTEENWRGKRAWKHLKAELEAKGQEMDWNAYIPRPVPDDENIFKAPKMSAWFIGRGSTELSRHISMDTLPRFARMKNVIAELTVISPDANVAPGDADLIVDFDALAAWKSPAASADEPVIPMIQMEDVPLTEAIQKIARMGKIDYTLDPKIPYGKPGADKKKVPEPAINIGWKNVTARQALSALLNNYGLVLVEGNGTSPALVTVKSDVVRSDEIVQLLTRISEQSTGSLQGPSLSLKGPQLITFYAASTNAIKPVRVLVRTNKKLSTVEAGNLCAVNTAGSGRWKVEAAGTADTFRVYVGSQPGYAAADYLAWSDQFESDFNTIREAVKRPYAVMPGDYQKAFAMPIPNFVAVRATAQMLASRAQCHLLLNQPDEALRDLTLIHDLRALMEAKPTGRPMTLVAAMINVAVAGLYADTIADGFRLHAWREPQLIALQKQLDEINLLPPVKEAFVTEPAAMCQMIENTKAEDIKKMFNNEKTTGWKKFTDRTYLLFAIAPQGWRYQNIATIARVQQPAIEVVDLEHNLISPRKSAEATRAIVQIVEHGFPPYTLMAAIAVPNYTRAAMVLALNQTKCREAMIASALERYHLAHGDYPESLDALAPQYLQKVPVELIGGQPLKYRRVDAGKFALYSIGWNERDDGGSPYPEVKGGQAKYDQGDWVWAAARD
jgi:hypothetical protein